MNSLTRKLRAFTSPTSRSQRIALIGAILIVFSLGIMGYTHHADFSFEVGLAEVEVYWRPAPAWLLFLSGSGVAFLLLAFWLRHRKKH